MSLNTPELGAASALHPAGSEAAQVAGLFWLMTAGAAAIWVLTLLLALYAVRARRRMNAPGARRLIVLLGVVLPFFVLGALLYAGLRPLASENKIDDSTLRIAIVAERFWWRVEYVPGTALAVTAANEIRLPLGLRTVLLMDSPEVIHSLWIPALAGKVDLLPGRTTRLVLEPQRPGRYAGLCAEYCGPGHAHMALTVEVMPEPEFAQWLQAQRAPIRKAALDAPGAQAFVAWGCPACHALRGVDDRGRIGPDLTHLGSRPTLAAGRLPMNEAALRAWIRDPVALKSGALMPGFGFIPEPEMSALSQWLASLR